jgi:site-specific DNA recombinase
MKKMKRAVIYTRVSTDIQAEEGYSLQTQLDSCRNYAIDNNFVIVAELADDCSGTLKFKDRPQGRFIRDMATKGEIDAVILYTLDRTARDETVTEYLFLKAYLYELDIELHYSDTGLDAFTFEGNLMGYIKASQSTGELFKIVERTTRGRYAKARANIPVMNGYPPYGYIREGEGKNARMHIYEPHAQVVRSIFDWYVNEDGSNGALSLYNVARKLNNKNIPPPNYSCKHVCIRWLRSTVKGILNNEIYAGVTAYGKTQMKGKGKNKKRVKVPKEEWVNISVPELAIVERWMFDLAQVRGRLNLERSRRNQKHEYLLTGHFRCGACNHAMAGLYTTVNDALNYRCGRYYRKLDGIGCANSGKTISTKKSETPIWDWVTGLILDESSLMEGLHRMAEKQEQENAPRQERLKFIVAEIENVSKRITRLVNGLADEDDKTLAEAIKAQLKVFTKQKDLFEEERVIIENDLSLQSITVGCEQQIIDQVRKIRSRLRNPTIQQKREILNYLDVRAVFYDNEDGRRIWVTCGIKPEGDLIRYYPS